MNINRMWLINVLSVSTVLLVAVVHVARAEELNTVAGEESTTVDAFDAFQAFETAEETIDPQKEYARFKSAYDKLYKLPVHSKVVGYQQLVDERENRVMTTHRIETNSDDENDVLITTTSAPAHFELQSLDKSAAENDTDARTANDHDKQQPNPDFLVSRLADAIGAAEGDEFAEQQPVGGEPNKLEQSVQRIVPVYFVPSDAGDAAHKENDTIDYVNDDGNEHEENSSQPITMPYSIDTTVASVPLAVSHVQTNAMPAVTVPATTTATMTTTATIAVPPSPPLPAHTEFVAKKSAKKIETSPRLYKYSADEIIRKYLDDTFIRTPLATLINTAPEPLRKSKILWKSALRPNTPIDIVLVAFNSSGVGVTYSFKNTRTMMAGLDSVQESLEMSEGGSGFYGILRASELVPYDSAIFISTDKIPTDASLMKNAAIVLLKKRIRLYLIWLGDAALNEDEASIGGTLGAVALRSGGEIFRITEEPLPNGEVGLVTHFLQNDIQGAQLLNDVNSNGSAVHKKRPVDFDGTTSSNGEFEELMHHRQGMRRRRQNMRFEDSGEDDNVIWPDEQTTEYVDLQPDIIDNSTDISERMAKTTQIEAITRIDVGAQSQLLPVAGSWVQLYFDVTNLREIPIHHNFLLVDEQRFLRSLEPTFAMIPPGQTFTVRANCFIPSNIVEGTKDRVTLSAQGLTTVTQSLVLTVKSPNTVSTDRTPPLIYWNFGSRCYGRSDAGRCASSIWSLEITTLDAESGIMRLQSSPKGLLVRNKYTAGTREEIKATYSASCCTPRVTITSYDAAGNQKTISIDVNDIYLGPGEIAAIILGVILLIVIIAAIVVAIVYCCKRKKESRDLPVYRGRAERE